MVLMTTRNSSSLICLWKNRDGKHVFLLVLMYHREKGRCNKHPYSEHHVHACEEYSNTLNFSRATLSDE
jgi:hypothetical protein